jgi:hypothetical protein
MCQYDENGFLQAGCCILLNMFNIIWLAIDPSGQYGPLISGGALPATGRYRTARMDSK